MARYRITIPPPKARRMSGNCEVKILFGDNLVGDQLKAYKNIPIGNFEFELPDEYEWLGTATNLDGPTFTVHVIYTNQTGSRTQKSWCQPERIT